MKLPRSVMLVGCREQAASFLLAARVIAPVDLKYRARPRAPRSVPVLVVLVVVAVVAVVVVVVVVVVAVVAVVAVAVAVPVVAVVAVAMDFPIVRYIHFVVPAVLYEVDPPAAGIVFPAVLTPVLCMARRHVQVERRLHNGHSLHQDRLAIDHPRSR